jgi:hypothetical protein
VGARVFIDRQQKGPVGISGWQQSLDAGPHTLQLKFDGYDDSPEQTFTIVAGKTERKTIDLTPTVTTAFLAVSGGTPGAQIFLDGTQIGVLDSNGSFGSNNIKPDVDHPIQFKKQYFEDSAVLHKQAPVKQTISISTEAKLKLFGTLVLTVTPPQAQVTIQRRGEAQSGPIADRTIQVREGTYTVRATAGDQYLPYERNDVQISSGQQTPIEVRLNLKPPLEPKTAPPEQKKVPTPVVVQLTDLFRGDPKHWQRDQQGFPQGFWTHDSDELVWIKEPYFEHTFQVFLKKGTFGTAKLQWRTFLDDTGDNYFEFELSDREFKKREVVDRKSKDWEKPKPHGIAQGGQYILRISVQPDRIENSIGQMNDRIDRKVEGGVTGFYGKVVLKLIPEV